MLKRLTVLGLLVLASFCFADDLKVGDVVNVYDEELFSITDRITAGDVEYLYTFRGLQKYQEVVVSLTGNIGFNATSVAIGAYETEFVIEKAIPLTGNYDIDIDVDCVWEALRECGRDYYHYYTWDADGKIEKDFYCQDATSIVIGDSCFEENKLVESVRIRTGRSFQIGKRVFYGATKLKEVIYLLNGSMDDCDFRASSLTSIGESAFDGCINLEVLGFDCSKLERIDDYAFNGCCNLQGFATDFESLSFGGNQLYNWVTPKLSYIGAYAFNGAGGSDRVIWTFENKDIIIGESAFSSCCLFKEIHFPSNMEKIVENSFVGLSDRKGRSATLLYLPKTLTVIEPYAFANSYVQVVEWPSSLKEIGDFAFHTNSMGDPGGELYDAWDAGLPSTLERLGVGAFEGSLYNVFRTNSEIYFVFCGPLSGTVMYPAALTSIPRRCFAGNARLEEMDIHDSVTTIDAYAFQGCSSLNLVIPASVRVLGEEVGTSYAFRMANGSIDYLPGVKSVVFEGVPPKGIIQSKLLECSQVIVPVEYASEWAPYLRENVKLGAKVDGAWVTLGGKVISNAMRPSNPSIMDIKYKVTSTKEKVNVRLLAFEDGQCSFAKVLVPKTLVDGTAENLGDGIAANVEHTVSWQVSQDWDVDLAKLSVEVYVQEDNLLPLQLTTIRAMGDHPKITFSRNDQKSDKVMNALYWLYADNPDEFTLEKGVLKSCGKQLANGSTLSAENAIKFVYSKMGYETLSGDTLNYVNELLRTNIKPSGIKQYAVKEEAAQ